MPASPRARLWPRPRTLLAAAVLGLAPLAVVAPAHAAAAAAVADPAALVDPTIGTSGFVDDFVGADVPFGMVQWSPDTPSRPAGGGYEYRDSTVTGFSLTHISGPGCGAAGDVPILPTSGAVGADPDAATLPLDHAQEHAQAGRYALAADGITTELTATTRSGMGRFSFPSGADANLLLKLSDSQAGTDATHFQVLNAHEVAGSVTSGHFCGADDSYTMYFDLQFDSPIAASGTWRNDAVTAGARSLTVRQAHGTKAAARSAAREHRASNGAVRTAPVEHGRAIRPQVQPPVTDANGAYLTFDTSSSNVVQAKVGISYVSSANAKRNRTVENPGWDFDATAAAAHTAWNDQLKKIAVTGGSATDQTVFYTALYHALLHPNVYSDVNREYMGFDGQPHRAPAGHTEYANFSGWDIYRSQAQLEAMVAPDAASDEVRSMLDQYDQTGQLPKWELYNGESYVMVGDPADSIIADIYAFGGRDFNTKKALSAMLTEANQPNNVRPGLATYLSKGYLPIDADYGCCNFYGPVSTQQEYNVADHAISSFAAALGDTADAAKFAARANSWQNVFNPATGFLQPKDQTGQFAPNFTPGSSAGFVEGNSYQYTPMEPQDLAGAIAADGGRAAWIKKLDGLTAKMKNIGPENADFGNEPSIEIPWEYDYAGAPYKTQEVVRRIQQQIFTAAPAGIAGNDDLGTMSAWYVFSALGFYPETPGTADLALGSPVFPKAVVHLAGGDKLTITGDGAAADAPYVQSLAVNGRSWSHAYLKPSLVTTGGTLRFTLGTTPNTAWASAPNDAPPSDTTGLDPALGFADVANVIVEPGRTATVRIGARALRAGRQAVTWHAGSSDGPSASPASGTLQVRPGTDATQTVTLTAPSTDGRYPVSFAMVGADGTDLPPVVVEVDVAKPGELWPYYTNAGISSDGHANQGNFDNDGWSYSSEQLAADGITPGARVTIDGIDYTMPDTQPGENDNIVAAGQTIALAQPIAAGELGILGSATNASGGAEGDFTVNFTDGTSQSVHLGLADWTLGAGGTDPLPGNVIAADTPYRDDTGGGHQVIETYLFAAKGAITGGKQVESITLPATVSSGELHLFAFTVQ
jgi:predicted alpha-1,2-mannosidase